MGKNVKQFIIMLTCYDMKNKLNYLNVGCGSKYHKNWINIDMYSSNTDVIKCNLLKGIPFPDEKFEIVYHSQVLEHIMKEKAIDFMKECYRVLKMNGTIRVVVPDLENIVNEYKTYLKLNLKNSSDETEANYDWIMLEMYDQTVRNYSGGQMAQFLQQEKMINEQYIVNRIGYVGRSMRKNYLAKDKEKHLSIKDFLFSKINPIGIVGFLKIYIGRVKRKTLNCILNLILSDKYKIGNFRLGGEIHMWMYDSYSLSRLLLNAGFKDVKIKNAFTSDIQNWNSYELDVKDGLAYDPTSLFMEAKKY